VNCRPVRVHYGVCGYCRAGVAADHVVKSPCTKAAEQCSTNSVDPEMTAQDHEFTELLHCAARLWPVAVTPQNIAC
jgi:hypothetical protein